MNLQMSTIVSMIVEVVSEAFVNTSGIRFGLEVLVHIKEVLKRLINDLLNLTLCRSLSILMEDLDTISGRNGQTVSSLLFI